jgi:hypothetical protein
MYDLLGLPHSTLSDNQGQSVTMYQYRCLPAIRTRVLFMIPALHCFQYGHTLRTLCGAYTPGAQATAEVEPFCGEQMGILRKINKELECPVGQGVPISRTIYDSFLLWGLFRGRHEVNLGLTMHVPFLHYSSG